MAEADTSFLPPRPPELTAPKSEAGARSDADIPIVMPRILVQNSSGRSRSGPALPTSDRVNALIVFSKRLSQANAKRPRLRGGGAGAQAAIRRRCGATR